MNSIESIKICLITPRSLGHLESFYPKLEEALSGGIRAIQFRNKDLSKRDAFGISLKLRALTARFQSLLIVNDDVDLALASGADGVHIGQEDFPLEWTRKLIGPGKIVGVSTHNLDEALCAEEGGADYIGFGSIFPTATKAKTVEVGLEGLKAIVQNISIPIIAIGGISSLNLADVLRTGASGVAVISAVWDQSDVKAAVAQLNKEANEAFGKPDNALPD